MTVSIALPVAGETADDVAALLYFSLTASDGKLGGAWETTDPFLRKWGLACGASFPNVSGESAHVRLDFIRRLERRDYSTLYPP